VANRGSRLQKNNNRQSLVLPINKFGQQRLNSAADWLAAKGGQVFPHFEHIVSGGVDAAMLYHGYILIPLRLVSWSSVGRWLVGQSTIRVSGL
jgi:hypothetical protein